MTKKKNTKSIVKDIKRKTRRSAASVPVLAKRTYEVGVSLVVQELFQVSDLVLFGLDQTLVKFLVFFVSFYLFI